MKSNICRPSAVPSPHSDDATGLRSQRRYTPKREKVTVRTVLPEMVQAISRRQPNDVETT
jgi:hypothetical protein